MLPVASDHPTPQGDKSQGGLEQRFLGEKMGSHLRWLLNTARRVKDFNLSLASWCLEQRRLPALNQSCPDFLSGLSVALILR